MSYSNLQIFIVELIGTFILVVFATGSIVYDVQTGGTMGIAFAAVAPFIALIIGIYSFGKISLAHFNPAVTIGFYITGHISKIQIAYYFAAEIIGALFGSLFVMNFIGTGANLGANALAGFIDAPEIKAKKKISNPTIPPIAIPLNPLSPFV